MQSPNIWLQSNMKEVALAVISRESLLGNGRASLSEGCGEGWDVGIEKVVHGGRDTLLVIGIASDAAYLLDDNTAEAYWGGQYKSVQRGKINTFPGHLRHG